jgi:hypothetical protein
LRPKKMSSDKFKPNMDPADQAFEQYLEQLPAFQPRPQFQADLRARLLIQAAQIQPASNKKRLQTGVGRNIFPPKLLLMPSWIPVSLAAGVVLLVLAGILLFLTNLNQTQVANAFDQVYDPDTKTYVDSAQAAQTLGFPVNIPAYLPPDYKVEPALAPPALENDAVSNPNPNSENADQSRTLQVSLTPKDPQPNSNQYEIYETQLPFNLQLQNPVVNRAERYQPIIVQGEAGYLVQGTAWRITFQVKLANRTMPIMPRRSNLVTPGTATNNKAPNKIVNRPMPFLIGRVPRVEAANPRAFIQFLPGQRWNSGAKTIVWEKNDVLFVLVASPNVADTDLQRIANSLQAYNPKQPNSKT